MKKRSEKIYWIETILDHFFPNPQIPLFHEDPFTLLIAVLLSAQCTDERVNQVTPSLFRLAKTPQEMRSIPPEEIERIIHPCGLFKKKREQIQKLCQSLIDKHQGIVPNTFEELEALAGVGHKTASVMMVQAFKIPAFPIDTHIFRCAHRWGLSEGKTVEKVEEDLKKLFPKKDWGKRHLQIILYARKFCPAKGHQIERCPICQRVV